MNETVSISDYLEQNGTLTYPVAGSSMRPLLRQGRDLATLEKKGESRCRTGDVALFRRGPGRVVLHRVVKVLPDGYVMMGDNTVTKEDSVAERDVIGVMNAFVRNGKTHPVTEKRYRLYSWFVLHTIPLRVGLKKAFHRKKKEK